MRSANKRSPNDGENDVIMTSSPLGAPLIKVLYLITLADEHMDLRIYILEFSRNNYGAWKTSEGWMVNSQPSEIRVSKWFSNFGHLRINELI